MSQTRRRRNVHTRARKVANGCAVSNVLRMSFAAAHLESACPCRKSPRDKGLLQKTQPIGQQLVQHSATTTECQYMSLISTDFSGWFTAKLASLNGGGPILFLGLLEAP